MILRKRCETLKIKKVSEELRETFNNKLKNYSIFFAIFLKFLLQNVDRAALNFSSS